MKRSLLMTLTLGAVLAISGGLFAWNLYGENQLKAQKQKTMQSIADVLTESNRDVQEMQAIVKSHAEGPDRVHAMATAVPDMTPKMKGIDTSKSPADFQQAFLRYRQAWEAVGDKLAHMPQNSIDVMSQTLTNMLTGSATATTSDPLEDQNKELRAASNDLEALALRYGVSTPVAR